MIAVDQFERPQIVYVRRARSSADGHQAVRWIAGHVECRPTVRQAARARQQSRAIRRRRRAGVEATKRVTGKGYLRTRRATRHEDCATSDCYRSDSSPKLLHVTPLRL